jgi:hypothetical protein
MSLAVVVIRFKLSHAQARLLCFLVVGKLILIEIFNVVFLHLAAAESSLILDSIAVLTPLLADFQGLGSFVLGVNKGRLLFF